ncbi:MAG: GtrA family protein [Succinivibrionaceae bacterium]
MINLLLKLLKKHQTFIKFLAVGGLNTAFGYGVYAFFVYLNVHYSVASFLSTVAGIIFNFFTTGRLVFKNSDNSRIFLFFGAYFLVWLFNVICIWFAKVLDFNNLYIIGFVLIFPSAVLSYILMKKVVFRKKNITDLLIK